jgi:hypothetical protein
MRRISDWNEARVLVPYFKIEYSRTYYCGIACFWPDMAEPIQAAQMEWHDPDKPSEYWVHFPCFAGQVLRKEPNEAD